MNSRCTNPGPAFPIQQGIDPISPNLRPPEARFEEPLIVVVPVPGRDDDDRRSSDGRSKRLKTSHGQGPASAMVASKKNPPRGLGTVPYTGVTIFPTVASHFWDGKPMDSGNKQVSQVMQVLRDHRVSGPMDMWKMSESKDPRNVQVDFLDAIARKAPFNSCLSTERVCHDNLGGTSARTNAVLGVSTGIANSGSLMHGYMHSKSKSKICVSAVFDVKNDCEAPKEGNLEAICNATNVALGLASRNIAPDEIVVPIFSTNGECASGFSF